MERHESRDRRPFWTLTRTMLVCLLLFNILIIGLAGWTLHRSYQENVERAEATTHNLAQVLEQNLAGQVHQIDLALLAVQDEVERTGLLREQKQIDEHLQAQFSRIGILNGLRMADDQGLIIRGVGAPVGLSTSVADRSYFQHLKEHPEAGLFIAPPILGRISQKWIVIFARRLNQPNGGFGGVVFGSITVEDFTRGLSLVDVGPHGTVSLRGEDLGLIARYPTIEGLNRLIGDRTLTGDYGKAIRSNQAISHFTESSTLDGSIRTYTMRRTTYPTFYILVGLSQADYLRTWRRNTLSMSVAILGLLTLSSLMAWMGRSAWHRQGADKLRLARLEEKYRLIAENALDVTWTADADGYLTYVSPMLMHQSALPPEVAGDASGGHQAMGRLHEEIWSRLAKIETLASGSQPFDQEVLELALPTKGGELLHAEVRVRVLWGQGGELQGFQGVTRDITNRKATELALVKSESRFRSLFNDAPVGHALNRMEDGWFLNVNESYAAITGYSLEELNQLSYWDLTPREYADQEAKQLESLRIHGHYGPYEKEYVRKDGTRVPILLNGSRILDTDGTPLILSAVADITDRKKSEEALKHLLREQEIIFENVNVGISLLVDRRQIWFNRWIEDTFQYSRAEMEGQSVRMLYPTQEAYDRLAKESLPILQQGGTYESVQELVRKDGQHLWIRYSGKAMDAADLSKGILWLLVDVTNQRQAERALRESEARYLALFNLSPEGISISRLSDGVLTGVNDAWEEMFGMKRGEALGHTTGELGLYAHPEDRQALYERLPASGKVPAFMLELRRKGGTAMMVELNGRVMDIQGERSLFCILRDVTEKTALGAALQESENRLRTVAEGSPVPLFMHQEGRFLYVNPAGLRLMGAGDSSELLGTPILDRVHPEDRERVKARIRKAAETNEEAPRIQERFIRMDGTPVEVEAAGRLVLFNGQPTMVLYAEDITDRKRGEAEREHLIEELQRALEEVKSLSGMLPICGWCKKIRDDSGYWNQIEAYISEHSEAQFSHGVCPDCAKTFLQS